MAEPRRPQLFFDASALIAGVISAAGAARALLLLSEAGAIEITVSEQVIAETERTLARKAPTALHFYRETLRASRIRIVKDPPTAEVAAAHDMISHEADVPILVAAIKVRTGYLVTLNRRHFIDDPEVARRSDLRIGTPGDALAWVRERWAALDAPSGADEPILLPAPDGGTRLFQPLRPVSTDVRDAIRRAALLAMAQREHTTEQIIQDGHTALERARREALVTGQAIDDEAAAARGD